MRSGARVQAADTLDRILRTGAYSNVVVAHTAIAPPTDHGFYQRLVYTVLRYRPFIDRQIQAASSRAVGSLSPTVAAVLRVGVAELCILDTADHAAVHEAVESVRLLGPGKATSFVNAVLRSVAATHPAPSDEPSEAYPQDVIDIVRSGLGSGAHAFLRASNEPAGVGVRFRHEPPESWARYATHEDDVDALVQSQSVAIMDPASASVVAALDPQPEDRVVDLAAAPGGKTMAIGDATHGRASILGVDRNPRRLTDAAKRLDGEHAARWVVGDAGTPPLRDQSFDRVLLDAPCTGLGTLRRRPEIRFRVDEEAPQRYGRMQRSMVEAGMRLLTPGGRMVYSVCTVSHQETMDVVAGLGFHPPDGIDGQPFGDGILLAPHTTGTDGMFIAVLDR